jgi:HSP20 family protein
MRTNLPTRFSERGLLPELPATMNQLLKEFRQDADRFFGQFGLRRGWLPELEETPIAWMPDVEMIEEKGELIVRADLPGLEAKDVKIEAKGDRLVITGERKQEKEEKTREFYRSERSYGAFARTIPLPEGAIADAAKASFVNGVLEIRMPTPPRTEAQAKQITIETAPVKESVKA